MKLIYIHNTRIPNYQANSVHVMKTCEALAKKGINITLIFPHMKKIKELEKENIFKYYNVKNKFKIVKLPSLDPLWIIKNKNYSEKFLTIRFYIQNFTFAISCFFYLLFLKEKNIFYTRDYHFVLSMLCHLKKFFCKKLIFESHSYSSSLQKRLPKQILKKIDYLVVPTQHTEELYKKSGFENVISAPSGFDPDIFNIKEDITSLRKKLNLPLNKKIICYTGNLYGWKGIFILLEAIKLLPENFILYVIGGSKDQIEDIRKKADNKVVFKGHLKQEILARYAYSSDILVIPNTSDEYSKYATSPIKLFEYMALKKPVIASDLPALREILRHKENSILVEPDNPISLASAIQDILKNESLMKKITENAYKEVLENYTWDARVDRIIKII